VSRWRGKGRGPFTGRCDYCGTACYGTACDAHKDLPQLENELLSRTNEQTPPRSLAETNATGSERKEA
jgi:hypothetical protein